MAAAAVVDLVTGGERAVGCVQHTTAQHRSPMAEIQHSHNVHSTPVPTEPPFTDQPLACLHFAGDTGVLLLLCHRYD